MDGLALELLQREKICALAVAMADGAPHAAALHYSEQTDPVTLFFQTFPSVKTKVIEERGGTAKAAVVVGMDENDMKTLQMRGDIHIISDSAEQEAVFKIHYAKHPEAEKRRSELTILLAFVPTWWRYTDLKGKKRIES